MPSAEVLSQGDEVVTGQIADTNAAWLATQLTEAGFDVLRHTSAGDRAGDLTALFREAAARSEVVICTGGLGPTTDDLTAECAATAFQDTLVLDPIALQQIEERYAAFNRPMPAVNRKQAMLPGRATRIDNPNGTAPGFCVEHESSQLFFLPGVPFEMRAMFSHTVLPTLLERHALTPGRLVTLRSFGAGESSLQESIATADLGAATLGWRASMPDVLVKLRFPASTPVEEIRRVVHSVYGALGRSVYAAEHFPSEPGDALPLMRSGDLSQVVGASLLAAGTTLAVAESCTGGLISAACTKHSGASQWFEQGAVTYSNASKVNLLGVRATTLQAHGAVSEPVAREMAEGVRAAAESTYGLSCTGIAGPGGGSPNKPVGTVHIALATPEGTHHRLLHIPGKRSRVQHLTVASALDLLRRHLDGLIVPSH